MTTEIKSYTIEDFIALPDDGKRYELVEGVISEVAPAAEDHSRIGSNLLVLLGSFIKANKLGDIYGADASFRIGRDVLSPDIAFVEKGRLSSQERGLAVIPIAPDLAVEVVSVGDTRPEVRKKVKKYQQAGVRLIWVVQPRKEKVEVYNSQNGEPVILGAEDELDGGTVVPGFKLKIAEIFEHA